jgi:4-hydroxy-tetrahydrodipicolinate reductase
VKIALHGYGRMGQAVERLAPERGHQIVAVIGREGARDPKDADVLIDFSEPGAVDSVIDLACSRRINVILGTTGWGANMGAIRTRVDRGGIAVVYASNFSPGANVLFVLARRAAAMLEDLQYAAGIEERHHALKKDAPSGTALRLAEEVRAGSHGAFEPAIASSRAGSEFGLHTLFFDSPDDLIEISHRARGRDGFARGALIAAERLGSRKGLIPFEGLIGVAPDTE